MDAGGGVRQWGGRVISGRCQPCLPEVVDGPNWVGYQRRRSSHASTMKINPPPAAIRAMVRYMGK